jgi:transcriptional antiterminator NusG
MADQISKTDQVKWYVIRTYSQYEKKVKEALEKAIENLNLKDKILKVVVPYEEIVEIRKNKKYIKQRPFFPGYVFVNMIFDQNIYWIIKNIAGVSGFLGGTHPAPLSEEEEKNILQFITQPVQTKPKPAVSFEKGENVSIIDGPFKHFVGTVEDVNEEKGKLKIMVTIFGRQTPVELDFFQVEKM